MKMFRIFAVFLMVSAATAGTEENRINTDPILLRHHHREGALLHADALVNESVYINGLFSHDAVISESSVSRIREVDGEGTAVLESTFRTEERIGGLPGFLEWISSEDVILERDILGQMIVPPDAARPVLRNIPVFPSGPIVPGDTWSANAREVHIFRIGGILAGPYEGEVPVAYEYAGDYLEGDRRLARILLSYNLYVPVSGVGEPVRLVSGRSEQELFWDISAGRPHSKTEEFEFLMVMSNGSVQEFRGQQKVKYHETMELDRETESEMIRKNLEDIPGINVSPLDEGIRLTLIDGGKVLFLPESSVISSDQLYRLEALKPLLSEYPERDILITGHTAHFGTPEGRYSLSADRAAAVASILFPDGRRGPGKLYLRGAGSNEPAANENSEEGRALNRRVEILILD